MMDFSCRSVREEWIKVKYVERRFVKPLPTALGETYGSTPDSQENVSIFQLIDLEYCFLEICLVCIYLFWRNQCMQMLFNGMEVKVKFLYPICTTLSLFRNFHCVSLHIINDLHPKFVIIIWIYDLILFSFSEIEKLIAFFSNSELFIWKRGMEGKRG